MSLSSVRLVRTLRTMLCQAPTEITRTKVGVFRYYINSIDLAIYHPPKRVSVNMKEQAPFQDFLCLTVARSSTSVLVRTRDVSGDCSELAKSDLTYHSIYGEARQLA